MWKSKSLEIEPCSNTTVGSGAEGFSGSSRDELPGVENQEGENPVSSLSSLPIPVHLEELYDRSSQGRSSEEKAAIANLLLRFRDILSEHDNDLGLTTLVEHVIDTGDAKPVKLPPRRTPLAFAGEDRAALEKLQSQGTTRPSNSPRAALLVFVRKRDGSVRPCVDFRQLNDRTKKDAFPIPRTQDCLDALEGSVFFSTLDITSAYNQIPIRDEDIPKTAFVTKYGLYEFITMPFGLCNAPATFQRLMEIALGGLQWSTCLIYLDDVIVFSKTFREHLSRLEQVLEIIHSAGLKLKPRKCHLFESEVTFLGHVLSQDGLRPNPDNIQKLMDWPVPGNVTEVRGFLGLRNYYRRFVRNYSQIAQPLIDLTRKGKSFTWSLDCQKAFDTIKNILSSAEVMAFPADEGEYILDTDASDKSLGAVLSQVQGGVERVVPFGSRSLNKAERNYCVTDRELLAVKVFVEHFRQYLLGKRFRVRTDHQALRWLFSLKEPKARIARWIEILSAFDFEIEYRPGQKHGNADALSRCPQPQQCHCSSETPDLKCGPCSKCVKRSDVMQSSFLDLSKALMVRQVESGKLGAMLCPYLALFLD